MSEIGFPPKDLVRRRTQTVILSAGLAVCTATSIFIVLFGDGFGIKVQLSTEGLMTAGFRLILSRFILVICVLNVAVGAVAASFPIFTAMLQRVQDIGVIRQ